MSSVADPPQTVEVSDSVPAARRGRPPWLSRKTVTFAIAAVVVLVAVGGGAAWLARRGPASASGSPVVTTSAEHVTVTDGTMRQTISTSGTLEPAEDSDLTFAVSGTVNAVDVAVGQKVTKGETLATIDSAALSDDVQAAAATLTSAEDRLTTDEDDSATTSTIDSDESAITSDQSQLSTAQADLSDAALKATFSGTVAQVDLAVGDAVSSGGGDSGSAGSSADSAGGSGASDSGAEAADAGSSTSDTSDGITVISSNSYTISTSVDDTEVGEVKVGDAALITPADSAMTLEGKVASVSLIAASTDGDTDDVATFPVVIDVTGSPSGIYPGASATADIVLKQLDDVVEVPTSAISYSSGQATVTEVVNGSNKTVSVTTGASFDDETEITGGLKAGDVIVENVTRFKTPGGATRSLFGGGSGATRGSGFGGGAGAGGGFAGGEGPGGGEGAGGAGGGGGTALFGGGG